MSKISDRLKRAWNVFTNKNPTEKYSNSSISYTYRPDRPRFTRGNEKSIVNSIYNRIALDVSSINIRHVKLDENDRYLETINSDLNECLSVSSNIDQLPTAFIQDVVISMFNEGVVAIVPVDADIDSNGEIIDVQSLRTGKILEWSPKQVKVNVYNENTGRKEDVWLDKSYTGIVENPFYSVVNEHNSTMKRLVRKLVILDAIDEQSGSGKLDLIIQLPYAVKNDLQRERAETRRKAIEEQLADTKYGIAYADATEKITQLNRSVGNNLMSQIEFLTSMLYSQLGITQEILNGTADEKTMTNYLSRTVGQIITTIALEMKRKFLSKESRSDRQSIEFFNDPFKLVPVSEMAEMADKLTRNEIVTSNEVRQFIGMLPSKDPKADELRNKNIAAPKESNVVESKKIQEENQNE